MIFLIILIILGISAISITLAMFFRRVVRTNEVHIVQMRRETKSFGKDTSNGNVYYEFPAWIPIIGVTKVILPTSNFDIRIDDYEAYDVERLPFKVDLTAFFRISESNLAAQRVSNFEDLHRQLEQIIKSSVRSILSSKYLNNVLQIRSELGKDFTESVMEQLKNWGVEPVKTIELMDIRDSEGSHVIKNIMSIKQSDIERQSRTQVADNRKQAEIAEIQAKQEADVTRQEAEKMVGLKRVEAEREVSLSEQRAAQLVEAEKKNTTEQQMAVKKIESTRQAEIDKEVAVINAEKDQKQQEILAITQKQVAVVQAEAEKEKQVLIAQGQKEQAFLNASADLELKTKEAEGILRIGEAEAESKRLFEISLVSGQIKLAEEIGSNDNYQRYLIEIRQVEANERIGIEQAKALTNADIKLLINDGNVGGGLNRITDILSGTGGVAIGNMLENLSNTPSGNKLVEKLLSSDKGNENINA